MAFVVSHPFARKKTKGWGTEFIRLTGLPFTGLPFIDSFGGEVIKKFRQVLPEKLAAVDDLAAAHMEEIDCQAAGFEVIAEDIGVVVLLAGGDALFFLQLMNGGELIAEAGCGLILLRRSGGHHARGQSTFQFGLAAFKKQLRVAHRLLVDLGVCESLHTGPQAAMNVVFQAGARMEAREVHLATGQQKTAMNQLRHAVSEIAGEVRSVVGPAILAQAPGYEDFWKALVERELHIGVRFVIAEQDVESRLALLDEVIFEGQGFVLVGHQDVIDVHGLAHERAGFGIGLRGFKQVRTHS